MEGFSIEVAMRKDFLALTAAALLLLNGAIAASAQQGGQVISPPEQRPAQHSPMHGKGAGMTGQEDITGHGMMAQRSAMAPPMMHMMFSLMDADGDGTISLQEFQAAHERIFKAIDADKNGRVTLDEMKAFMHGTGTSAPQQGLR